MIENRWLVVAAVVLTAPSASRATEPGFYLAASLGQAEEDPTGLSRNFSLGLPPAGIVRVAPDSVRSDSGSRAWSLTAGYQVNPYLAVEVGYHDFGATDIAEHYDLASLFPPFPAEFTAEYSSRVTGPALSVLGMWPVTDRFDVYLRAGALFAAREIDMGAGSDTTESFASTVWLGGAGVSWSFADRWAVRAEYLKSGELDETLMAGATELEQQSLSALFRF